MWCLRRFGVSTRIVSIPLTWRHLISACRKRALSATREGAIYTEFNMLICVQGFLGPSGSRHAWLLSISEVHSSVTEVGRNMLRLRHAYVPAVEQKHIFGAVFVSCRMEQPQHAWELLQAGFPSPFTDRACQSCGTSTGERKTPPPLSYIRFLRN